MEKQQKQVQRQEQKSASELEGRSISRVEGEATVVTSSTGAKGTVAEVEGRE